MDFLSGFLTYFVIALVVFPWIAGPIALYLKFEMPGRPEFFPITDSEIESSTGPDFAGNSTAVESLGFEQVANLQWTTSSSKTFARIFYRPDTQEAASVSEITTYDVSGQNKPVSIRYIEFVTDFVNGLVVDTNNSHTPGALRPVPQKQIHALPESCDAALVYKVHRHVTGSIPDEVKPLPPIDLIEQRIEQESIQTLKRQIGTGYLYYDEARSAYKPTAKGATLMAWKLLWPVLPIRKMLMRRDARRLLEAVR